MPNEGQAPQTPSEAQFVYEVSIILFCLEQFVFCHVYNNVWDAN
jgi:hypothetical protein